MFKLHIDSERLIHSFKAAIACTIGILLTRFLGAPADQWIVITIIVVMCAQIYVGSVRRKAYLRYVGTLIGCLLATLTLVLLGHTSLAVWAAITVSTFIFSYFATEQESLAYAGTLGAVTTAIIMLGPNPTFVIAAQRFLEISAGIFIAAGVSQFIFPIHASTHLRRAQAKTLAQLRDYYTESMITYPHTRKAFNHHELDENIVKSLLKQRQLAKESVPESLPYAFDSARFARLLYFEREMLRAITFMHHAVMHITQMDVLFTQTPKTLVFNEGIIKALNALISSLENKSNEHIHIPSLDRLKEELQKNTTMATPEGLIYVNGFLFSANILLNSLTKLAKLYHLTIYMD